MSEFTDTRAFESAGYFTPKTTTVTKSPALLLAEAPVEIGGRAAFLAHLGDEDYRRVSEVGSPLTIRAGESVFCQGDPHDGIFLIESGSIRTFYTGPTGREITLAYWTPGHFVGGPEIFGGGIHVWSGVAVQKSDLLYLRGSDLRRLMEEIPSLALGVVEGLVQKGKCYSALVQMLGTRSVVERLAQLLLILADKDGRAERGRVVIRRVLTHEELANMVGSTRQWVTASLKKFEQQGMLEIGDCRITLLDYARLRNVAGLA